MNLARSTTRASLESHVAVGYVLWVAAGHKEASVVAVLEREGESLAGMGAEELLSSLELGWKGTVRRQFGSRVNRKRRLGPYPCQR